MLKHFIFIIAIGMISFSCNSSTEGYIIKGTLTNAGNKTLFLDRVIANKVETIDSLKINENGNFKFSGKINEPGIFMLRFSNKNYCYLIADTTDKIEIKADAEDLMSTYTVEGSVNSKLIKMVNAHNLISMKRIDSLRTIYKNYESSSLRDSVKKSLDISFNKILDNEKTFLLSFIVKNKCTFAAFMALYQQLGPKNFILNISNDFPYFKMVDSCLAYRYKNSEFLTSLHNQVIQSQNEYFSKNHSNIGDYIGEIELSSPDGKIIKLSSLKGKYVLLDFWASWCRPCRAENPNIVANYIKYHRKGFEIYSVSLDQNKQNWIDAIKSDKLTWNHVSDMKYWNSPLVARYQIKGIPANFLLDKDGKIIGKNLRGDELGAKLAEVFK